MGAPFGNKNGLGHGRPPSYFSDEQAVALGEKLLKWLAEQENDPNSNVVHLSDWYSKLGMSRITYRNLSIRDCFRTYHEIAMEWMGRRILKNKEFPQSYGNRFLGVYFTEIKEHEIEMSQAKNQPEKSSANMADLLKVILELKNSGQTLEEYIDKMDKKMVQ